MDKGSSGEGAEGSREQQTAQTMTLSNGVRIPTVGFGTAFGNWTQQDAGFLGFTPEDAWCAIPKALKAGIRHFDTAYVYRTHRHLGTILGQNFIDGTLTRSEVFITTKILHPDVPGFTAAKTFDIDQHQANGTTKEALTSDFYESLDELGVGYVDLLLLHWPGKGRNTTDTEGPTDPAAKQAARKLRIEAWRVLEAMYKCGKARAIGVSNWTEDHIRDLLADGAHVCPHVNQIEMNPYTIYPKIVEYCRANNIVVEAYSPMGSSAGAVRKDPVIVSLANKYNKNEGQIILRWLVQQGCVILPRSSSQQRMQSNTDIFDFGLTDAEITTITNLNKGKSLTNNNPYDII